MCSGLVKYCSYVPALYSAALSVECLHLATEANINQTGQRDVITCVAYIIVSDTIDIGLSCVSGPIENIYLLTLAKCE